MFDPERQAMVEEQLERRGVVDQRVLDAMAKVPRELFVDEADRELAYADVPLRIGHGQTISQPYMVAIICQAAAVQEGDRVLDVGAGSGYQAAVLAELGADVHTVERIPELAARARANLDRAGYERVSVHVGDGSLGLPELAPFDAIVVAAAAPSPPRALYEQLAVRGRRGQRLELIVKSPEGPALVHSVPCRFVPLLGAEGYLDA